MKKTLYGLASLLIVAFIIIWVYESWAHATFVDRTITAYTGIKTYTLKKKEHSDFDWYAEMSISRDQGALLLARYPFRQGFSKSLLARKLANPYVEDCPTCWYYFRDEGSGPYDYKLLILSETKEDLAIYELFGN